MSGVCLVLCAFFANTLVVGVCLALSGIGIACVNLPLLLVVKDIFPEKFLLVGTVSLYGYTAGTILLPFIVERSLEAYGYSGTFLILGGITLNIVVCALAIRRPILREPGKVHHRSQIDGQGPTEVQDKEAVTCNELKNAEDKVAMGPVKTCSRHKKSQISGHFEAAKWKMETCTASKKECTSEQAFVEEVGTIYTESLPLIDNNPRVDSTLLNIHEEPKASSRRYQSDWKTLLFKEPLFWFNILTIFLMGYVLYSWMLFLVPHAEQLGIPESHAVFISSIAGIGGIIGRTIFITMSAKGVNVFYIYIGAGVINTLSFLIDFIGSEYSIRAGLAIFQGISFFAEDSMYYAIPEKTLVNQNNFSHANALLALFYGLGASSAGYITGFLFDITQSYTKVFIFNGIVHAIIVVMVIITTICLRKRQINISDGQE